MESLVSHSPFCIKEPVAALPSLETAEDNYGFPAYHRGADHSYRFKVIGVFVQICGEFAKEECFCKYGVTLELL